MDQSACANARTALGFDTKTARWGAVPPKHTNTFYGRRRALLNPVLESFRVRFAIGAGWRGVCVHDTVAVSVVVVVVCGEASHGPKSMREC